jgi:hypothetical protein
MNKYFNRSLAQNVGCDPKATTKELVECLQKVNLANLIIIQTQVVQIN